MNILDLCDDILELIQLQMKLKKKEEVQKGCKNHMLHHIILINECTENMINVLYKDEDGCKCPFLDDSYVYEYLLYENLEELMNDLRDP